MHLEQFLSDNGVDREPMPQRPPADDGAVPDTGAEIGIQGFIVSHDQNRIRVLHLGTDYFIDKDDIVDVASAKSIFGSFGRKGQAADIRLRRGATITTAHAVTAGTFAKHMPFAFRVPTWMHAVEERPFYTDLEWQWLRERGLLMPAGDGPRAFNAAESSMTEISTPGQTTSTTCGTASGNVPDVQVNTDTDDTETSDPTSDGLKNDEGY